MLTAALLSTCVTGIAAHEGFRNKAYKDRNGIAIGNGYSLTHNPLGLSKTRLSYLRKHGITKAEANGLTRQMLTKLDSELTDMSWYKGLSDKERYVVLDMSYNLGVNGITEFKRALHYVHANNNTRAAGELLNSRWARQVGTRAVDLANVLRNS